MQSLVAHGCPPQQRSPLSPDEVYSALTASLSADGTTRTQAQALLQEWEADSSPGFIGSLLNIVHEVNSVPEEARLMATVVAKNAVGSSWRKIMGTREWSRVPDAEKAYVRTTSTACLLSEPSSRVAVQLALLISNLARFDVPRPWDSLVGDLAASAGMDSPTSLESKLRSLRALKHCVRGLKGKRFAIDTPNILMSLSDNAVTALTSQIDTDRGQLAAQLKALLPSMQAGWQASLGPFLAGAGGWEGAGRHAVACLAVLVEVLGAVQELGGAEEAFASLMREGAAAAAQVAPRLGEAAAGRGGGETATRGALLCKAWERLLQCALAGLDRHPLAFAAHVPAWATLCASTALLGLDAAAVHHIRTKSRVLLTRFTARVLIQPMYRPDFINLHAQGFGVLTSAYDRSQRYLPSLTAAQEALDGLLAPGQCSALVQAVVTKYIALSSEELEEWQADAEGFARQVDVETSPDADTPRPCGVALLECMLERETESVSSALVEAAGQLQTAPLTRETLLLREATYRALGECFSHVRTKVDFPNWYETELRGILQPTPNAGLDAHILQARALWLVGVCGEELGHEPWDEAFGLCAAHISSPDLVVALMAVSACTAMVAQALEESAFLSQAPERHRMRERLFLDGFGDFDEAGQEATEQVSADFTAHTAAITRRVDGLIGACFSMLPGLEESESMVRVLHAVSTVVELLGSRLAPHLAAITDALPGVWGVVAARRGAGPGAAARLHAALIGVLAHLVGRLGLAAVAEPRVGALLAPLLRHATDVASTDSEPLLDDGLRLWRGVLQHSTSVSPLLADLFAHRFMPLLARGQDMVQVYCLAEAYLLLGGVEALGPALQPLMDNVAATFERVLASQPAVGAAAAQARKTGQHAGGGGAHAAARARFGGRAGMLQPDEIQEALSAASLAQLVLQQVPRGATPPPSLRAPLEAAAALAGADFGGTVARLPARALGVLEAAMQVISAALWIDPRGTWALVMGAEAGEGGDSPRATRMLDRWVSMSLTVDMAELFLPPLAVTARARRHEAAVVAATLLCADAAPQLRDAARASRVIVLGLKAVKEAPAYRKDVESFKESLARAENEEDQLTLRRLSVATSHAIAEVDVAETVRAAAQKVAAWHGEEALLAALRAVDGAYPDQLRAVLQGGEESEMLAALEAMNLQKPDDPPPLD
ncbi:hypothetical protein ACKKBG_A03665 [Auxenochlorella protothecoides x Auxenochlorella symbiontica]